MPSKEEKKRRQTIRKAIVKKQRAQELAQVPISGSDLKDLFAFVDKKLESAGCDHTMRHTLAFLEQRNLAKERIIAWLAEHDGYCDCEVIANVEEHWIEITGDQNA
ncbi:MAG: DUF2695 domain-containing protein [Chloroflexi bacterium]|nr:DUF2695 domain-containing protein [Chloroflexota bacterium]